MEQTLIPQNKMQKDIDQLNIETKGVVPFVPQGLAWKLTSPRSIDPGHIHTEDSIDLDAILDAGVSLSDLNKIPRVVRLASAFNKTNNTTMATITGFERTLAVGSYKFSAWLRIEATAIGGISLGLGGNAVASDVSVRIFVTSDDNAIHILNIMTNLTGTFTKVGKTYYDAEFQGTIVISTAGTFNLQFAQAVASGTSTVVAGSFFEISNI